MNTKARTTSVCILNYALLSLAFAVALLASAFAQTSGPDAQRRAWDSGVNPPVSTLAASGRDEQQHSHATEAPLGDDLPAVPIQPLAQQARRLQAALEFLGQPFLEEYTGCDQQGAVGT